MAQPVIHTGYRIIHGGWGTVIDMVIEQPMDIIQAVTSMQKRSGNER
jgi:hypothetical protein